MNTLEKELVKNAISTEEKQQNLVEEAKLLLSNTQAEEEVLLKSIGLGNELEFSQKQQSNIILRNKLKDKYGKDVVTLAEINKLCRDYRLYLKEANSYIGRIPPSLGAELNSFCKERNIPIAVHSSRSDFFIIAPPKMFIGYKTP